MKIAVLLLFMITLVGCTSAGYNPSYISDVEADSYIVEE